MIRLPFAGQWGISSTTGTSASGVPGQPANSTSTSQCAQMCSTFQKMCCDHLYKTITIEYLTRNLDMCLCGMTGMVCIKH